MVRATWWSDTLPASRDVGLAESDTDWGRTVDTVEPDENNREVYEKLYRIYRSLYQAMRKVSHALSDLQKREANCRHPNRES